jgi:hypothetical protein
MKRSSCHKNCRRRQRQSKGSLWRWFGLALSEDGCWRIHSWLTDKKTDAVIETTEERILYYGGPVLTEEELKEISESSIIL